MAMSLSSQAALVLLAIGAGVLTWSYIDWRRRRNRFVSDPRLPPPSVDCERRYVP